MAKQWSDEILGDGPIPELKRALLRSRLVTRLRDKIMIEMRDQKIVDRASVDKLAERAGLTGGELEGMLAQPGNATVEDFADVFVALFRAELDFKVLPIEHNPWLNRPVGEAEEPKPAKRRPRSGGRT